jgi:tRNA modification GTPase
MPTPPRFRFLTAPGPAAIAVVSLSGAGTAERLSPLVELHSGLALDQLPVGQVKRVVLQSDDGEPIDDALLSVHSISPEWEIRLHLHGGRGLRQRCMQTLENAGFIESRDDALPWAVSDPFEREAISRLSQILTEAGVRWLLAQPARLREAIEGIRSCGDIETASKRCLEIAARSEWVDWFAQPLRIAIAGEPNTGKSTLINALAERSVSLVSPQVGTTRDWVSASGEIAGFPVEWLDTAGLFGADDALDAAGVQRSRQILGQADLVALAVPLDADERSIRAGLDLLDRSPEMIVRTCADRADVCDSGGEFEGIPQICVSAIEGLGLSELKAALLGASTRGSFDPDLPAALSDESASKWRQFAQAVDINELKGDLADRN